ncbi:MAG TPA: ATP-dependent Clp protease proteolytic subunit [Chlamydiales bacterium]|jgi:ATP-dependent protease ClpP protease subunit|nr:ATP-dependent Clp protease proteolytic subunit [Chlamydiales bacterium]
MTGKNEMPGTVYISFTAPIDLKTAQSLNSIMFQKIEEGFDHLYLMFSTGGGDVASGLTIYNTIRSMPAKVTIHNVGNVDSIGNAIFLSGKERFTCKHATFMFHGVARQLNGWTEEKPLRTALDFVLADQLRIGSIIAENTSLPLEEITDLFSAAQTKDADFAVKFGMAHGVKDVIIPPGSPVIPLVFDHVST